MRIEQSGSEGGQDQRWSMPEEGSTEDFASIDTRARRPQSGGPRLMDRSIFLVRVVATIAGADELA